MRRESEKFKRGKSEYLLLFLSSLFSLSFTSLFSSLYLRDVIGDVSYAQYSLLRAEVERALPFPEIVTLLCGYLFGFSSSSLSSAFLC